MDRAELRVERLLVRDRRRALGDHAWAVLRVDVVTPVRALAEVVLARDPEQIGDPGTHVDHRVVVPGAVDVEHGRQVIDQSAIPGFEVGQARVRILDRRIRGCEEAALDRVGIGASVLGVRVHKLPAGVVDPAGSGCTFHRPSDVRA